MKKETLFAVMLAASLSAPAQQVMTRQSDGTVVINTTTLAKDVEGYNGPTPLEVHIKKNKIVKVEVLKSQEGPKYVAKVKKTMLPKYEGVSVKKGTLPEVDGATGATFTSNAIRENISRAVS